MLFHSETIQHFFTCQCCMLTFSHNSFILLLLFTLLRFPVSISDSQWHYISIGVSSKGLTLYVDCVLVERVKWVYPYMGITTEGLLTVGGILEGFETPFEVSTKQETFLLHLYYLCIRFHHIH